MNEIENSELDTVLNSFVLCMEKRVSKEMTALSVIGQTHAQSQPSSNSNTAIQN